VGSDLTVYVRSDKIPAGEILVEELYPIKRFSRAYGISRNLMFRVKRKKVYSYVLPSDQKKTVEIVERLSERYGFELKIIDVADDTVIERWWRTKKGIRNFPFIKAKSGDKLQAPFSQIELEKFISKSILPTK